MAKHEAVFHPINCAATHQLFYARYDFAFDDTWVLSYGLKNLPVDIGSVSVGSSSRTTISGKRRKGPQYHCPYCGSTNYVQCGRCGKLTCYSGFGHFHCDHCGNEGEVNGVIERIDGNVKRAQV